MKCQLCNNAEAREKPVRMLTMVTGCESEFTIRPVYVCAPHSVTFEDLLEQDGVEYDHVNADEPSGSGFRVYGYAPEVQR